MGVVMRWGQQSASNNISATYTIASYFNANQQPAVGDYIAVAVNVIGVQHAMVTPTGWTVMGSGLWAGTNQWVIYRMLSYDGSPSITINIGALATYTGTCAMCLKPTQGGSLVIDQEVVYDDPLTYNQNTLTPIGGTLSGTRGRNVAASLVIPNSSSGSPSSLAGSAWYFDTASRGAAITAPAACVLMGGYSSVPGIAPLNQVTYNSTSVGMASMTVTAHESGGGYNVLNSKEEMVALTQTGYPHPKNYMLETHRARKIQGATANDHTNPGFGSGVQGGGVQIF